MIHRLVCLLAAVALVAEPAVGVLRPGMGHTGTGLSPSRREKRVVGGHNAPMPGYACSWPYIVIVEKTCRDVNYVNERVPYRCSGSIIDKRFVLTAKQCVELSWPSCTYAEIEIIAGAGRYDYDTTEVNRQYRVPKGDRKGIREHPDADIAVIEVNQEFSYHINVVQEVEMATMHRALGTHCMGAGWGRNSWAAPPTYPPSLQQTNLYIRYYEDDIVSLTELAGQHSGVYEGDSGGPIVYYRGHGCTQPEVVAVVNCRPRVYGGTCGMGTIIGEHASVATHREWVLNNTIYYNDDDDDYYNASSWNQPLSKLIYLLIVYGVYVIFDCAHTDVI